MSTIYKVVVSNSPFRSETDDEYGPYKSKWRAYLVAWFLTRGADNCREATILKKLEP